MDGVDGDEVASKLIDDFDFAEEEDNSIASSIKSDPLVACFGEMVDDR